MSGQVHVVHPPGSVRLDRYPLLVVAEKQWGDGVRTEDRGLPAREVAALVAQGRSHADVAATLGTTATHIRDAVRYVEDHPER